MVLSQYYTETDERVQEHIVGSTVQFRLEIASWWNQCALHWMLRPLLGNESFFGMTLIGNRDPTKILASFTFVCTHRY